MRRCLCTCFYLGELPLMPGTWGTLPALLIHLLLWNEPLKPLWLALILLASSAAAVPLGRWAEKEAGRPDPGWFTLDEFAGYLTAALFVDLGSPYATASCVFLTFRILDVLKPWPARGLERLPGGWGMLLDDLMAGVYANLFLQVISRVLA